MGDLLKTYAIFGDFETEVDQNLIHFALKGSWFGIPQSALQLSSYCELLCQKPRALRTRVEQCMSEKDLAIVFPDL